MYLRSHLPLELSRISPLAVPPLSRRIDFQYTFPHTIGEIFGHQHIIPAILHPRTLGKCLRNITQQFRRCTTTDTILEAHLRQRILPTTFHRDAQLCFLTGTIHHLHNRLPLCQRMNLDTLIPVDIIGKVTEATDSCSLITL